MARDISTKEKLVHATAYLMHRRGYHGVGLNDILKLSKAPKGVLYYHFPKGKPELAEAAIYFAAAVYKLQVEEATKNTRTAAGYIRALGKLTVDDLELTKYKAGCPLVTIALETAPDEKRLTDACKSGFDLWVKMLAGHLEKFGVVKPDATAELILSTLEGAMAIARTRKDASIVTRTAEMLARQID